MALINPTYFIICLLTGVFINIQLSLLVDVLIIFPQKIVDVSFSPFSQSK